MPRLWDLRLQWDCRISLYYENDNTVSIHIYVYSENKPFPINTVPPTSIWDKIPENETSIPFTVYGSSTYWLPLNKEKKKHSQNKLQVHEKVQIQSRAHQKPAYFLAICSMLYPGLGSLEICGDTLCYKHVMTHWQKLVPWIQIAALLSKTKAPTFITRANLSKQFPTAMSIVSPNILYRRSE